MNLGSLFADIDIRSGNALGTLSNFGIRFSGLAYAAKTMGQMFDKAFGSVIRYTVEMEKLNDTTGFNIDEMQRWKSVAEQNNVSFDAVAKSMKKLQENAQLISWGQGNIKPYQILGIDPRQDPTSQMMQIKDRIARLTQAGQYGKARSLLGDLGMSEEMLVLFKNWNGEFDESIMLTEKERSSVMALNREWIMLKQTTEYNWNKAFSGMSEGIGGLILGVRELTKEFDYFGKSDFLKTFSDTLSYIYDNALFPIIKGLSSLIDLIYSAGKGLGSIFYGAGSGNWKQVSESLSEIFGEMGERMKERGSSIMSRMHLDSLERPQMSEAETVLNISMSPQSSIRDHLPSRSNTFNQTNYIQTNDKDVAMDSSRAIQSATSNIVFQGAR